jgi:hypothetical protein
MKSNLKMSKPFAIAVVLAITAGAPGINAAARYACTPAWEAGTVARYAMAPGGIVLAFTPSGTVQHINLADGAILKTVDLGMSPISKPLISGDMIIMGCSDGSLSAFSLSTGKKVWSQPNVSNQQSSPVLYAGRIYVGTGFPEQSVFGYDASSGKQLLVCPVGEMVLAAPACTDNAIFAGTTQGGIFGIDAGTGTVFSAYRTHGEFYYQAPVFAGDKLLISPSGDHRKLESIKLVNGLSKTLQAKWTVSLSRKTYMSETELYDMLSLRPQARNIRLAKMLEKTGAQNGEFIPTSGSIRTSGWVVMRNLGCVVFEEPGLPPLSRATVLITDANTGEERAKVEKVLPGAGNLKLVNPVMDEKNVIACLGKGTLIGLDRSTGVDEWEFETNDRLVEDMALQGDMLVTQTAAGKIKAYRIPQMQTLPLDFALRQNFPNPFRGTTAIRYDLPVETQVQITIHDASGRMVASLVNSKRPAGYQQVVWNGRSYHAMPLAAGTYFARLRAGSFTKTIPMVKIR